MDEEAVNIMNLRDDKVVSKHWAPFDGIPLCHEARTPEDVAELAKKGACGCRG